LTNQTVRIFVSSPGDLRPERMIACRLAEKLDREFGERLRVESTLWEREPLFATDHFQASITPPHETDIVVVMLWSRLGVTLPIDQFPGAITGRQVTGTEWEFEDAFASYRQCGRPEILFYLKRAPVVASLDDDNALEDRRKQKRAVEDFMRRWFIDAEAKSFQLAFREFDTPTEFEEMLEGHLSELLATRVNSLQNQAGRNTVHWLHGSPYRGLESFELEHAAVFFGRRKARNELRELLARQTEAGCGFVLVMGASGSGKSSLVKAGLLPDLRLPGMIGRVALCRYAVFRPAEQPDDLLAGLARALMIQTALPELEGSGYDAVGLAGLLREAPNQAAVPIRQALDAAAKAAQLTDRAESRLALVVDQLEELFTLENCTRENRLAFVAALEGLARTGLVWVVGTMRSDFFDRLEDCPPLARLSAGEARYLLTLPGSAELRQIITQPAREAGLRFETNPDSGLGLDEELCSAASQAPSALPLLQFTLEQLWKSRSPSDELGFAAYRELGGLEGALGRRAEDEFSRLPPDVQAALPQLLRALATIGQGTEGQATARVAALSAFAPGSPTRRLIEQFVRPQARLLVAEGDDRTAQVRIAHEALLTHWARAREQLQRDRTDLQVRGRLEQAAALWQASPPAARPGRLLPAGLPLAEASDLLERRRRELGDALIEYVAASVTTAEAATRRGRRRLQATAGLLAGLALLAALTAVVAYSQKRVADREKQIALAGELAARGTLLAEHAGGEQSVEAAAALAVESWKRLRNTQAYTLADRLLKVLPMLRIPHGGTVWSIAFSPDGRLLATGSQDRAARLFDAASGREIARFGHGEWVADVAFSPNGRWLATASADNAARLIDVATAREQSLIQHDGEVRRVLFSPDNRFLATASLDRTARIIDPATGRELERVPHDGAVNAIAFSPDSRVLATGSRDRLARLVDTGTGKVQTLIEHAAWVFSVAFSPDGRLVATGSQDGTARIAESANGHETARISGSGPVSAIAFSPDGNTLATGSWDTSARLLVAATGRELHAVKHDGEVWDVGFSPDGRLLATASADRTARLVEVASGRELARVEHGADVWSVDFSPDGKWLATGSADGVARVIATGSDQSEALIHGGTVFGMAFSPDGSLLATASADHSARLFSAASGRETSKVEHGDEVYAVLFSPDGHTLATASRDGTARLIEVSTGLELWQLKHGGEVRSLAFSPDGRQLATGSLDGTTRLIDHHSGTEIRQLHHEGDVRSIAFSPDGLLLATAGQDKAVTLIDPATGRERLRIEHDGPVSRVVFNPSGMVLATASDDRMARLIETATGKVLIRIEHGGPVLDVAFDPQGDLLATSDAENTVHLIDVDTGRERAIIEHGGPVMAIAFSPDGRLLATGSQDTTSRLIDTATGREIARIDRQSEVWAVAFSPDGRSLAIGGKDGRAQVLWTDPQRVFDRLCASAGRNLSKTEWQEYFGAGEPWRASCDGWRTKDPAPPEP
jgi:WD40 repeat protein